jgi:nicotinate-nucleotide adenylyltransferase
VKLGIYGGTFDPIHVAHLIIAEYARCQFALTEVVFIPSFIPPHKINHTISSAQDRLQMVKLAIDNNPHFRVSDFEINKQGASFTVDTLDYFTSIFQLDREHLYLIIGADNLADFNKWREPERILSLATLAVAARPGHDGQMPEIIKTESVHKIHAPIMDISASKIRDRVREGGSIRYLTPPAVEDYIHERALYQLPNEAQ